MRILFTMGHAYFPQRGGGAQSNTDQLIKALQATGHTVGLACTLSGGGWTEKRSRVVRRLTGAKFSRDMSQGYPVYRAWDPSELDEVVAKFRPDVAVVQNGLTIPMARSLRANGVPTAVYFHNVEFDDLGGDPRDLDRVTFVSNSEFTARRVEREFGLASTVIRPFVPAALYRTATSRENVTFINPYPEKGADIAFAVAERCPEIPFVFVESWGLPPDMMEDLRQRMAPLPNVTLLPRTTDMKSIYAKARVLLAPSRWEEAWGRVATEAQFCGIPVVGSRQGGLPEAIGPGGVTIDIGADMSTWAAAVRQLWTDREEYERLSQAALEHSQRADINPDHQIDQLIEVLRQAAASPTA
jgi:glycosyltransferase involved in cell wall biosynthesis